MSLRPFALLFLTTCLCAVDVTLPTGTITGTQVYGPADVVRNAAGSSTVIGTGANVTLQGKTAVLNGTFAVASGATFKIQIVTTPPTVALTAPASGSSHVGGTAITVSATATDPDAGGSVSKVDFYAGSTLIGTDTTSPYSISWANPTKGSYSLTARATDNSGTVGTSAGVPITVTSTPPAVALSAPTANTVFTAPASVTLTATATDSDSTIAKVEFFQGTTLLNTDTISPYSYTWTNVAAGSYSLTAKATDSDGVSRTSTAVPIIVNTLPTVSLTSPTNGSSHGSGTAISLTATAADSDGTISKIEFLDGATVVHTSAANPASPYSFSWTTAPVGTRTLTARATDNRGGVKTSGAVTITVTNTPPTVALTSPQPNTSVPPGTVTLTATASDANGTVTKVEFFNGSTKLGEDLTSPYSFSWTSVPAGTYPLLVQATDNDGAITSTAYIPIIVGTNTAPTADFSLTNSAGSFTVSFDGTLSSDPDGDQLATYAWTFTNVATGQPTTSSATKPTVTLNSAAANFTVTLRVTDNRGAQSTILSRTYTQAEISGGNQPPPQESEDKKIIYVGETTFLSLDMSNDRGKSANWTQNSASGGKVLFYNPRASSCQEWQPQFNDVFDSPQCWANVTVKGSQPGKVTISVSTVADTEPTQSGQCGQNGSSVSKTYEVTVIPRPEPPPKMPLGSKYRRVDAHGIPMPDPSPTGEGESDRVPNMAYTDMFSLSPTYATSDLSVPVDGGELTLEFRRTMSIKSRNYNTDVTKLNITYPVDDLLGLGWDTNLGSRVIITERKDKTGAPYLVADVTDETGGSYGYRITGSGTSMVFLADLAHSFNNEAIKAKLTVNASGELILTKPHGTKVTYQQIPRVFFAPFMSGGGACSDSLDLHKELYYRVKSISDRNGNRLDFAYNNHWAVTATGGVPDSAPAPTTAPDGDPVQNGPNGDMVVRRITFVNANTTHQANDTKRVLRIRASWHKEFAETHWMMPGIPTATGRDSGWRIDKVIDPLNRETLYTFANYTEAPGMGNTFTFTTGSAWLGATIQVSGVNYPGLPGVLTRVTRPAAATFVESTGSGNNDSTSSQTAMVQFAYDLVDLRDTVLDPVNPPQMDGNIGINRYIAPMSITDARGHVTSMTYQADWFPISYYPTLGSFVWQSRIRLKTMATQEDGTANFNMAAFPNAFVTNAGAGTIDLTTDVTDVRGVKTTFKFAQKITLVPNEVGAALYVTKFERITDGTAGNGNTGKAVFEFSDPFGLPDPNGNLTKVTDMSGNVIQFVYRSGATGDTFDQGLTNATGALNGYYNPNSYMAFNKPAKRIVDPGGLNLVTEYRYDKTRFNKQSDEYDAEGIRTRYVFDAKGNRTEVQEGVTGTTTLTAKRTTKYAYDASGFITQVTDPDNRVTTHVKTFNAAAVSVPAGMADTAGETAPVEQAYQQVVSTVKGYANELTLATTTVSDVLGNSRWVTDPRGNSTRSYYDTLNRVVKVKKPAVVNGAGATVTSVSETFYDLNSNVRKQTDDEGNATVTTYDRMNRATKVRVRMSNPTQNIDTADLITQTNYRHGSDTGTASVGLARFTTDANGRRTDYAYDNLLRLTTTTFPTVTLPGGSTTRYTMVNTYGKNSGSGAFAYWSGWQPVRVKDKRGYYTDTNFDKINRPTRVIRRASTTPPALDSTGTPPAPGTGEPTTETFYTKTHKPVRQVTWSENWAGSASNQTTWTSYDSLYRQTLNVVDGNNGNGSVTAVSAPPTFVEDGIAHHIANAGTNANALMTATAYDKAGNVLKNRDQLGREIVNTYDGAGRVTQIAQPTVRVIDPKAYNPNDTDLAPTVKYTYDANGNRTLVEDANHTKTQTTYDARNRATQVVIDLNNDGTYSNAINGADIVTTTRYNLVGKPVIVTDSRGYATDSVYDRAYRLTIMRQPQVANAQASPVTNVRPEITRTYDKNGNLLTIQDARQKIHASAVKTVNTYDELNRLRTKTEASGDASAASTTETQYDANGNIIALLCFNSAGSGGTQTTTYTYDAYDRQLTEVLPTAVSGSGQVDTLTRQTSWTYYRDGAVRTSTDAKGQVHEREYDRAERLTRSRHKLNGGVVDETRTLTYSKTSKPLTVTDKTGTTTYTYDALDRQATEARATTGQTAYTVQHGYDAIGQRTRVIYPVTSRTTLNHYDRGGRLVRVNDAAKNTDYTYDAVGNRLTITEPNGVVTTNTYDALNRCLTSFTGKSGTTVSDFTYAYDLVGNRLTVIENIASQGSRTIAYTYDAKYQITGESWSGYSNTYTYDLAGNRLTKSNVVGATTTLTTSTYDTLNRLLTSSVTVNGGTATGTAYTYDLNGNQATQVTGANTHTFTWDVHNRLLNVTQGSNSLAATYDYRTRRETTNVNGAGVRFFRYDGGVSFHELLSGALQVEFLRGPDMGGGIGSILYSDRTMVGGVEETFAYNPAVGHVTALTNSAGATVDSDRYDAFGNIVGAAVGTSLNNRQANTKERNTIGALVLDNHGFRYYNPVTGRYLNRDPLGYADGMNQYAYVHNNPVNSIDPHGLCDWFWKGLRVVGNVSSGIADAITFGAVGKAQDAMGVSGSVDRTGVAYRVGGVAGDVMVTAATGGAAGGAKAVVKAAVEVAKSEAKAMAVEGATHAAAATGVVSQETAEKIVQGVQVAREGVKAAKNAKKAEGDIGVMQGAQPESPKPPPTRRQQTEGDVTLPNQEAARQEAMRRHGAADPDLYETTPMYGKNENLKGPKGEPYEKVTTVNKDGEVVEFDHHAHGHEFKDANEFEYPHYHGPKGEHVSYPPPEEKKHQ